MFDFSELMKLEWLDEAACADVPEALFFVEAGHVIDEGTLNICRRCPVRAECVRHAYRMGYTSGYFGGLSPGQRRQMNLERALEFIATDLPTDPEPGTSAGPQADKRAA